MDSAGIAGRGSDLLFRAKVLGNTSKGAIVLVQGRPMEVGGSQKLVEGRMVDGRVVQDKGRLLFELKRDAPIMDRSDSSGKAHLGSFLKNHGVLPSAMNLLAGYKAIQLGQPLTPDLFVQVQKYANLLPELTEKNIHSLLLMLVKGMPMQKRIFSLTRRYLDGKVSPKSLLRNLIGSSTVSKISLGSFLPELNSTGIDLRKFFLRSGINTESYLARMDSLERDLLTECAGKGKGSELRELKDLLSLFKIMSQGSKGEMEQMLALPYLIDGELEELLMHFRREGRGKASKEEGRCCLDIYLEMSRLGRLKINFIKFESRLSLMIKSPMAETVNQISENKEELKKELMLIKGITIASVSVMQEDFIPPTFSKSDRGAVPLKIDFKA